MSVRDTATATSAITEDVAWMAHFSDSDDNDNTILGTNVTLEDLLEVDEELRKEMNERRREYYSVSGTGNMATYETAISEDSGTRFWVHEMTGSKLEEQFQVWDGLVEGEREDFNKQVDETGNQPIPQPVEFEPEPEDIDWPITLQVEEDPTNIEIGEPGIVTKDPGEEAVDHEKDSTTQKGTKLPLAHPEEQGECGGKATNGEAGKGVTEVNWGIETVDKRPKETSMKELEPAQLRISRRLQGSRRDDAKSVSRRWNDTKSVPRWRTTRSLS